VEEVNRKSDAWKQGLRAGDVIVAADGVSVLTGDSLNAVKDTHAIGQTCGSGSGGRAGTWSLTCALWSSSS
jgi:S1-C subfamily serine protease